MALRRVLVMSEIEGLVDALHEAVAIAGSSVNVEILKWEGSSSSSAAGGPGASSFADTVRQADVVVADPPLAASYSLVASPVADGIRWMQSTYAGCDALLNGPRPPFPVARFNAPSFGPQIAEYVLGWLLSCSHRQAEADQLKADKTWDKKRVAAPRLLRDMTMGILGGAGNIGQEIGRTAQQGFGMRTLGWRRSQTAPNTPPPRGLDDVTTDLMRVLRESDCVVSVLPSTPLTRGLLDGDVLSACVERRPVFINVGRGDVVSEAVVLRALDEGWIQKAVLDVFPIEPLPRHSPLWSHPLVHITPHIAAVSHPKEVAAFFLENLKTFESTGQLNGVVSWERGY